MKEIVILMLSGGLDSVYLLHDYLTKTETIIHAHHIILNVPAEPRAEQEQVATRRIVEYYKKNGYREFEYSESMWQFPFYQYTGWDSDLCLMTAAKIAGNLDADLISVALGACLEDLERPVIQERMRRRVNPLLWSALRNSMSDKAPNLNADYYLPLVDKKISKAKMVKELPEEVLKQVWSCRRPVDDRQCGQCESCKHLNKAKESL